VRSLAHALNKPVGYCVGSTVIEFPEDAFASIALVTLAGSTEASMKNPKAWIVCAGKELAAALPSTP
jgi:hypothetical protein